MKNIGVAIAGGHGINRGDRLIPTPREATLALIGAERGFMPEFLWEPACGNGAIVGVLQQYGYLVASSDIVDYEWGHRVADFTKASKHPQEKMGIVTNPPFPYADEFIRTACSVAPYVALLLKATFWNAAKRLSLWCEHTPTILRPLTWRLDFTGGGSPTMDCQWVIWDKSRGPTARFQPLERP